MTNRIDLNFKTLKNFRNTSEIFKKLASIKLIGRLTAVATIHLLDHGAFLLKMVCELMNHPNQMLTRVDKKNRTEIMARYRSGLFRSL